jgi:hypothetical protein
MRAPFFRRTYPTCSPQRQTVGGSPLVSLDLFTPYFLAYNFYMKAEAAEAVRRAEANTPPFRPPPPRKVVLIVPPPPAPQEEGTGNDVTMDVDEELEVSPIII